MDFVSYLKSAYRFLIKRNPIVEISYVLQHQTIEIADNDKLSCDFTQDLYRNYGDLKL